MTDNEAIAQKFEFIAGMLESNEANPYRVQAYRNAADTLRELDEPISKIAETEGIRGLQKLPGIGESLSRAILEFLSTGRMSAIENFREQADAVALISSLPGIGRDLAEVIYDHLGVETLEELEIAARSGDLAEVPGFGRKRVRGITDAISGRLGRRGRRSTQSELQLGVDELLEVDKEYREKAQANALRTIAPRRFNPKGEAWLPVLNTRRGNDFFMALFSNTSRAHELGKTNDWVVIYYDTSQGGGQATVVTANRGPLQGKRVVRGREHDCIEYYERRKAA